MFKNLLYIAFAALFVSCSSSVDQNQNYDEIKIIDYKKERAIDKFINGAIYEILEDYASASSEYQAALRYDESSGIYYALAKNYFFSDKLALALKYSKRAVDMEPDNIYYLDLTANIFRTAKMPDSALVIYSKIISIDSNNYNALYNYARLLEKKKPLHSLEAYNKLIEKFGPDWSTLLNIADIYERLGYIDSAVKSIERLVNMEPGNDHLQKFLVEVYFRADKLDKAELLIEDLLRVFPDDDYLLEKKALALLEKNDFKNSADFYKNLFESGSLDFESQKKAAVYFYYKTSRDSLALKFSRELFEIIASDSNDWHAHFILAEIASRQGDDSAAIFGYRNALKKAEWNPEIWIRLGGLYFDKRDYDEAIELLAVAKDYFPNDFTINLILGLAYSQKGLFPESEPYLKNAAYFNPNNPMVLSAYAFTLNQLKKQEEAVEYLKRSLQFDSSNFELWGMLGMIYNSLKEWEKCDEAYLKALELAPDNPLLNNNYAYSLSLRSLNLEEALKRINDALSHEPSNASYLDTKGWILFKMSNYNEALDYIERSLKLEPNNSEVTDHLGDVYYMIGNMEKAFEFWNKAHYLDPSNEEIKNKIERGSP